MKLENYSFTSIKETHKMPLITLHCSRSRDSKRPFTHYQPHFDAIKTYSCQKHGEKGEIACNKQFLLFSQCFLPCMALIFHFKCTLKCRLQFV